MWLDEILGLFALTLEALLEVPALRFFLVFPLFLVLFALAAWLVRRGSRGRL